MFTFFEWLERAISEQCIYQFNHKDFSDFEKISEGAFGIIKKSKCATYRLTVALKSLKVDINSDEDSNKISEDFIEEVLCFNDTCPAPAEPYCLRLLMDCRNKPAQISSKEL
ncbi:29548_t:CDS:2, partial [Racocetra persica]